MLQFIVDLRGNRASRAQLQANQMGGSGCFPFGGVKGERKGSKNPSHSKSGCFFLKLVIQESASSERIFQLLRTFFFLGGGVILHLKSECDWILLVAPSDSQLQQGQHADTVDCCPCNLDSSNVKGFVGCPFSIAREV